MAPKALTSDLINVPILSNDFKVNLKVHLRNIKITNLLGHTYQSGS